ncbi:MAG: hypothetical protein EP330_06310 [Deltaproteobacteria bacterium]|nr:MAG: hypothetical protein EP330_06310 [Deltaproteobacteria bacterium]
MRIAILAVLALSFTACQYSAPLADDRETPLNVIAGTVAADSVDNPTHTILFVTDAANPGPPAGTGSPETFTTVPGSAFTDPSLAGLSGAHWSITNVPDGDWLVSGFMDQDNDFYFSTQISVLAGATCGDVIGAHVADVVSQALAPVSVYGGVLADDVTVALAVRLTTERPAFTIESAQIDASSGNGPDISIATANAGGPFPQQFALRATGVHTDVPGLGEVHLDGPFDPTAPAPCQTAILTSIVDANLDGVPDEPPGLEGNGLIDTWPKIYLQYLGDTGDDSTWAAQAFVSPLFRATLAGENNSYDDDGDGTVDESYDIPLNTPSYLPEIQVTWIPGALHTLADGTQEVVTVPDQIPQGDWSITIVEETGQTWSVPNQLASWPSIDNSFDPTKQAATLVIGP